MDAEGAAFEDSGVACGLRVDDGAKADLLAGDGQIDGVASGDLEEDAGVGAAFVVLAGGVEKARAEADTP